MLRPWNWPGHRGGREMPASYRRSTGCSQPGQTCTCRSVRIPTSTWSPTSAAGSFVSRSRPQRTDATVAGRSCSQLGEATRAGTGSSRFLTPLAVMASSFTWGMAGAGTYLRAPLAGARTSSSEVRSTRRTRSSQASRFKPGHRLSRTSPNRRSTLDSGTPAGFPSGQRDMTVNHAATPSQVRILPPPSADKCVRAVTFSECASRSRGLRARRFQLPRGW